MMITRGRGAGELLCELRSLSGRLSALERRLDELEETGEAADGGWSRAIAGIMGYDYQAAPDAGKEAGNG